MPPRTIFLSRLIGLYLILISLSMVTHKQSTVETMTALVHNPPELYLVAVIAIATGLAMVLGHNVWFGGLLPVLVTLTGWLVLAKGALLLFLSPQAVSGVFLAGLHFQRHFYAYAASVLILGICLTYGGFRPAAR